MKKKYLMLVCAFMACLLISAMPAMAENRALLIGVGEYKFSEINDLAGIDLDIDMMQDVASLMGYRDSQIKTIEDENATYLNVKQAFESWLINSVSSNDKVFIYFSGHGSQMLDKNNDEADQVDELMVLHDTKIVEDSNGDRGLANILLDDDLQNLLSRIKSQNVLVMMDCCHSGTNTKSFRMRSATIPVRKVQAKFFSYPGMAKSGFGVEEVKVENNTIVDNFVSIAACADTEESLASPNGSYFTLGVWNIIRQAAGNNRSITPEDLTSLVSTFVDQEVEDVGAKFHPQISGNQTLRQKNISLLSMDSGYGRVWQELVSRVDDAPGQVPIQVNKNCYELKDALIMDFQIPEEGYLNIVSVDPKDEGTVLFPNKLMPENNRVSAGAVRIPTQQMKFKLTALDEGPVLVVAFLTSDPINLYQTGFKSKNQMFATLSPKALKNFGVEEKQSSWIRAGKLVTKILQQGQCQ